MQLSNQLLSIERDPSRIPVPANARHAIFAGKPVEELEVLADWRSERSRLVTAGQIKKTTLANEERSIKRFLRYIQGLGAAWPSTEPELIGSKDRARLGDDFLKDPFANPLPVVSGFFSQVNPPRAIFSAKVALQGFLPFVNEAFDPEVLDYLTQTPKYSKHPAVESWFKESEMSNGLAINYRYRIRGLLKYVAKKYLDSELHMLDMQDEIAAFDAIKSGKELAREAREGTVVGVLLSRKVTILAEFIEHDPEKRSKAYRSVITRFLESLDSKTGQSPIGSTEASTRLKADQRSKLKAPASRSTGISRRRNGSTVDSSALPGGPLYSDLIVPGPLLPPRLMRFQDAAQARQREGNYRYLGLGSEEELVLAMRDELLTLMRNPSKAPQFQFVTNEELANLKFDEVITSDQDQGIYILNPQKGDYRKLSLSDDLARAFQTYRSALDIPLFKTLTDKEPIPVFFVIKNRVPKPASSEAIAGLLKRCEKSNANTRSHGGAQRQEARGF